MGIIWLLGMLSVPVGIWLFAFRNLDKKGMNE